MEQRRDEGRTNQYGPDTAAHWGLVVRNWQRGLRTRRVAPGHTVGVIVSRANRG